MPGWRDELTIYREGFAYRRRGRLSHYRWQDIADVGEEVVSGRRLAASSVTLRTGETVRFAYRLRGLDLLSQEYADRTPLDDEEPEDQAIHVAGGMDGTEDLKPHARTVIRRIERPDGES